MQCVTASFRARVRAQTRRKGWVRSWHVAGGIERVTLEARARQLREGKTTHRRGNRRNRRYVDLHNDSPRFLEDTRIYVCMRARVYKRDSLSSITSEAAKERINLARGNYIRGKMRLLLIPINSHVALFLCDQD